MPTQCRGALLLALMSVPAGAAVAQTVSNEASPTPAVAVMPLRVGAIVVGGIMVRNVKGHPFAGEEDVDTVQTLADGTHITQATQKTLIYRDSESRTRTEHIFAPPPGAVMSSVPSFITIVDPVAGYRYTLDQNNHTARRMAWRISPRQLNQTATASTAKGISAAPATSAATASARPQPEITQQPLGTETIEGLAAEGKRTTVMYPEGFMGNDRPITAVTETWTSSELGMVVLSKMSDPRNGETTSKLTNISFDEPDPALFEVPAGYSIVDQEPMRTTTPVQK